MQLHRQRSVFVRQVHRVINQGLNAFDAMERHDAAWEQLARYERLEHTSRKADQFVSTIRQSIGHHTSLPRGRRYKATQVAIATNGLKQELRVLELAQTVKHMILQMRNLEEQALELKSGKFGVTLTYKGNGALIAVVPTDDKLYGIVDGVSERHLHAHVGGLDPRRLHQHYPNQFLSIMRMILAHGGFKAA